MIRQWLLAFLFFSSLSMCASLPQHIVRHEVLNFLRPAVASQVQCRNSRHLECKNEIVKRSTPLRIRGGGVWTKSRPNNVPLYLKLLVAACGGAWCFGSVSGIAKIVSMVLSPGGVDFLIDSYGLLIPVLFMTFHLCLSAIQLQKMLAVLPASSLPRIRWTLLLQVCCHPYVEESLNAHCGGDVRVAA